MRFPFSVFVVHENSMLPLYKLGDHVLSFNWERVKVGDVVVFLKKRSVLAGFTARTDLDQHYIKRVKRIEKNKIYVAGDNKKDSAKMPPITFRDVIGKVIWKY